MATAQPTKTRVFGIDFRATHPCLLSSLQGAQRSVVSESNGDVVLNELGSMTTATLVSFKGDERLIGESAVLSSNTNPRNTVDCLNLLLGKSFADVQTITSQFPGQRVSFEQIDDNKVAARVEYQNESKTFSLEQLTGMLFGKLLDQMKKRVRDADEVIQVAVAVPSAWGESEKAALTLASKIAGIPHITIITCDTALARCFNRKHPLEDAPDASAEAKAPSKHIAIVDIGHATTSVSIVKLMRDGESVLASECDLSLGADSFDRQLFYHFQKEVKEKYQLDVALNSKEGKRLFQACEKLKKLLSTIGEASVTVENISQDRDVAIKISRDVFEHLCALESDRVTQLMARALEKSQVPPAQIASVEIVGGGTRIPFVQAAILKAFGTDLQRGGNLIGRMLDSTTAIAVGAAFSGDAIAATPADSVQLSDEQQKALGAYVALEEQMRARDVEIAAIAHERNAIEAFVYEMRAKGSGKHGEKLDSTALNPLLDEAEDWIYSEESEFATLSVIQGKRATIEQQIREACSAYFDAVAADEKALEAHLEEEAKKAEAERIAEGNDDDHDTRKLKKPERMRLVVKNKEEGNELFRDGNHQHAAMRYVKALSHASKFFDLNEKDVEEVNKLKLSLYLNLAQCYLKMESWGKAIANCKDALVIDPQNAKALYRRALAYEKEKNIDLAVADVKAALKVAPEDKAIAKLDERLKLVQKRQLDKEKKMWSKAFA
ncbi:Hsp70-like protein, partial [Globisporangium splendens]